MRRLEIRGSSTTPSRLPPPLLAVLEQDGGRGSASGGSSSSSFAHLYEEVFAQDGSVEEYLAYDIREM